jgi:3-hydroxyacyl-CoA dehydrogenase
VLGIVGGGTMGSGIAIAALAAKGRGNTSVVSENTHTSMRQTHVDTYTTFSSSLSYLSFYIFFHS